MDRPIKSLLSIGAMILFFALATGCDSGVEEPAPPADSAAAPQAAQDRGDVRPPDDIPESRIPKNLPEGVAAAIPDNFPEEVPIYPGSVPARGKGADIDGVPVSAVQLMSNDDADTVMDYYVESLEGEGWSVETTDGMGGTRRIAASREGCRIRVLTAPAEEGGTNIIVVTECKES